jgi:hypothetical protein
MRLGRLLSQPPGIKRRKMPHTAAEMRALAEQWIEAWNSRDLDRIMDHYAEDVEFEANTVIRRWQKADGRLRGVTELRNHFRLGLDPVPNLGKYPLDASTCVWYIFGYEQV